MMRRTWLAALATLPLAGCFGETELAKAVHADPMYNWVPTGMKLDYVTDNTRPLLGMSNPGITKRFSGPPGLKQAADDDYAAQAEAHGWKYSSLYSWTKRPLRMIGGATVAADGTSIFLLDFDWIGNVG